MGDLSGLLLGPVMFPVNVNNMTEKIDSNVPLFTDLKLILRIKTDDGSERLTVDQDELQAVLDKWPLEINLSKCKVTKIGEGARRAETE